MDIDRIRGVFLQCEATPAMRNVTATLRITREELRAHIKQREMLRIANGLTFAGAVCVYLSYMASPSSDPVPRHGVPSEAVFFIPFLLERSLFPRDKECGEIVEATKASMNEVVAKGRLAQEIDRNQRELLQNLSKGDRAFGSILARLDALPAEDGNDRSVHRVRASA